MSDILLVNGGLSMQTMKTEPFILIPKTFPFLSLQEASKVLTQEKRDNVVIENDLQETVVERNNKVKACFTVPLFKLSF